MKTLICLLLSGVISGVISGVPAVAQSKHESTRQPMALAMPTHF